MAEEFEAMQTPTEEIPIEVIAIPTPEEIHQQQMPTTEVNSRKYLL